ncbi:zinc finger protein 107-like [Lutzomyia longipalpis]|uniref:zinc finger protein 107-like n=1 Tax=Lutzomyia longipalpis TaxID=7200 RepID=UPI0024836228|nr:zinc finger protein 107-like [Lutzomyia longipalpis]
MAGSGAFPVHGVDFLLSQSAVEKVIENGVMKDEEKVSPVSYTVKIVQQKNGIETQVFVCGVCMKEFRYQYVLFRHFTTHTDAKVYKCDVCSKTFRQTSTLQQHKAIHNQERPFSCDVCCKSFNRMSTLISHKKTHSAEKPYKCPVCQHGFHQKGNLRNHVYIHTNERPYRCPYCPRGFNQLSNLTCHKMKTHSQEEGIAFHCKLCNLRFAKKSQFKEHNIQVHKGASESSEKKPKKIIPLVSASTTIPKNFSFEKSIVIPYVDTDAMRKVKMKNEIPFGLLNSKNNISILMRIYDLGQKSIIREATPEDIVSMSKIPIVAIIDEKDGRYTVTMPPRDFQDNMNISDGKIFFVKQEKIEEDPPTAACASKNVFFGTTDSPQNSGDATGSHFVDGTLGDNSFSSLIEAMKIDGLSPDVPNIVKFFAQSPEEAKQQQTIKWEKIEHANNDEILGP